MNDQTLLKLIRTDKSDQALLDLYRHFPMMRNMIRSRGGNTADAEDMFQEALIILCRKAREPDFELKSKLSTYLFSICRFLWKDELKKRKRLELSNFETGLNDSEEVALNEVLEKEGRAKLAEQIILDLGERCRELLLLFYSGSLKLKEIAVKMGYNSENTAKNQKYKCLEQAKEKLKKLTAGYSHI